MSIRLRSGGRGRVSEAITGSLASWRLGTSDDLSRFGQGLGKGLNSWGRGILSQPMTYWNVAPLILTATGGAFTAGRVRLVAHWFELRLPD